MPILGTGQSKSHHTVVLSLNSDLPGVIPRLNILLRHVPTERMDHQLEVVARRQTTRTHPVHGTEVLEIAESEPGLQILDRLRGKLNSIALCKHEQRRRTD